MMKEYLNYLVVFVLLVLACFSGFYFAISSDAVRFRVFECPPGFMPVGKYVQIGDDPISIKKFCISYNSSNLSACIDDCVDQYIIPALFVGNISGVNMSNVSGDVELDQIYLPFRRPSSWT